LLRAFKAKRKNTTKQKLAQRVKDLIIAQKNLLKHHLPFVVLAQFSGRVMQSNNVIKIQQQLPVV